ncbi:alpha-beta hydrolase superfamily lysophospholipase [Dyadobacter jejuensis]|uniref:Alpha-beta hydrolase superfamily lysophospholipase n=1 Tax=Dyadobacter jejuensis TaxID=1082580 RepID=A0A316ADT2_9BACT|nr:alpha/beta fold hydrolase [Dyadobacter jejuensis]PWJ55044.1 alpha-beta hydrolase superfamily lysophospholipase [Dyadobacter jejuensis]
MSPKIVKRIVRSILISLVVYLSIALVLISWPITIEKNVQNYDYSSVKENSETSLGNEQWIKSRDNYELFNRVYRSENKDVLILIHGSGSESRYLAKLANSIAQANIATVLTPDMRGHGKNSGERGNIDFIGQLENDIEDLIQFSKKNLGAKRIILAGHSSGGGFVLRFIGNPKNTQVDKAILLAPYLGYDSPTVKHNSGGWVQVALKRIIGLSMLNNIGVKFLNHIAVLFFNRPENLNDKLQVPSYSYNMTINFNPKDYKAEIENIKIPCLVLVGDQDESFYTEQFSIAFDTAKKYTRLEILENVKHLDIVKNPHAFEIIKDWSNN